MGVAYWVVKVLLTPIFLVLWHNKVDGRERVPRKGPVVLAANHVAFLDSVFLPLVLRRRVTFVAKSEYFESWKTAWFFRAVGQIPMRREGGSASQRALASARDVLEKGHVLAIYPEGTRSPDGRLYKGHTGVARLALSCRVPVIPVGLRGTGDVQHPGSNLPRLFKRVTVRFGEPLSLNRFDGVSPSDPLSLRLLTDELMFEIGQLSGQEYVDRYAKKHGVVGGAELAQVTSDLGALDPGPHERAIEARAS